MTMRGFTLVEVLVATAIFLVIAGAASMLVAPAHRVFEGVLSSSDMETRARTGMATLLGDLAEAGSGAAIGPPLVALSDLMPVISAAGNSVTIMRIPAAAARGTLRTAAAAGDAVVELEITGPCFMQDPTCGFRAGSAAVVFDAARAEAVSISGVDPGTATLTFAPAIVGTFDTGAAVIAVERVSYVLRPAGTGGRLVRISPGGAEQPVVDHVAAFDVAAWPPEVGVRGTDVTLRVDRGSPTLRRGAGVQDLELNASVLLRER
jgi:prepilin-type N-terminal cleavage/methylation domain-containing protein